MTSVDLDLLAALFEDPLASYADLGRRVGMTGQGARKRLLGLQDEGVLRGFVATPVPAIFGRRGRFAAFEVADPDPERVLGLDDVVLAGATLDGLLGVAAYVQRDAEADPWPVVAEILDAPPPIHQGGYREHADPGPVGPLGWRVLKAILDQPRASQVELAEATGLTPRTAANHRERLLEIGAVEITPLLGSSDEGRLFFHLAVVGYEGSPARLAQELPGAVLAEHVDRVEGTQGTAAALFCEAGSLADQHRLVETAKTLPGVEDVRAYLLSGYHVDTERLTGWIDEALATWEQARRDP